MWCTSRASPVSRTQARAGALTPPREVMVTAPVARRLGIAAWSREMPRSDRMRMLCPSAIAWLAAVWRPSRARASPPAPSATG